MWQKISVVGNYLSKWLDLGTQSDEVDILRASGETSGVVERYWIKENGDKVPNRTKEFRIYWNW